MGNYNPDRPYVLGMQWAPLISDQVLLDPATEVGYTFRAQADWDARTGDLDLVRVFAPAPAGQPVRKELVVNLYRRGRPAGTGAIRTVVIPCSSGASVAGAALGGGAGSHQAAVQNPSDAQHVVLTGPNAAARFWFATTAATALAALQFRRILDVTVLYAVSGPFSVTPGAVTLGLERPAAAVNWLMDDTLTGASSQVSSVAVRRSRLGELNPWWTTNLTPATTTMRLPWTASSSLSAPTPLYGLDALAAAGGSNINVRLGTSAAVPDGTAFQVHYLALEVTYCEENRVGSGGLDISGGAVAVDGGYAYDVPVRQLVNPGFDLSVGRSGEYTVMVGQAYSGAISVASPVPIVLGRLGTIDAFPAHQGLLLRKTIRPGSVPTAEPVSLMPALLVASSSGPVEVGSHVYQAQSIATCYGRYGSAANSQVLVDAAAGSYVWARFFARHLPGTLQPLTIIQTQVADPFGRLPPRGEISVDDFDALPDAANGWKEVTVRLNPPVVLTGGGGLVRLGFASVADGETPWQVLGADHNPASMATAAANQATYDGETANARIGTRVDLSADFALMLIREMDPVTGFAVTPAVQDLTVIDADCARPADAIATGIHFHRLSWDAINSEMVAGWGFYEVQRQDDTMDGEVWETVATVTAPNVTHVDDFEARVAVTTRYRIRAVHRTGIAGPWTAPLVTTIPAPGVTGTAAHAGVLILTSNHHPEANLAYVMSWDRRAPEEWTFPEAGQVSLQTMFDRDFQVATRPTERGGVEFTRTIIVNAAAVPQASLDKGFRRLRDLAWDTVPYVCVRDELNNRWLSTLLVPSGSVQRRPGWGHLHLAQLGVVEVTDTPAPLDGGPAPCEGLRIEGSTDTVNATAAITPDTLARVVAADRFTRQVPGGGWGVTDQPGEPWQVVAGAAENFAVTGAAGTVRVVQYRNTNPFFDTDLRGWTAFGAAATRSTAQAHQGAASLLMTPDGVSGTARVESDQGVGAAVGVDWRATAWVRCVVARTVALSMNWFDAAGTYLGTSTGPTVALVANTWTRLSYTAASTFAGTARATVNVTMSATPPATHLLFVDEATVGPEPTGQRIATTAAAAGPDVDVRARFRIDQLAVGSPVHAGLVVRDAGVGHYRAVLSLRPDGAVGVILQRQDAAALITLAPEVIQEVSGDALTYGPGEWIWLRVRMCGSVLSAKAYKDGGPPSRWATQVLDVAYPMAGRTGVTLALASTAANQNVALNAEVDDVQVRRTLRDLDVRCELRPNGEDFWSVELSHTSLISPTQEGGSFDASIASTGGCFEVLGVETFDRCAPAEQLNVHRRQRRWMRWTYEPNAGGTAGTGRMAMYTSFDGLTWTGLATDTDYPEPIDIDPGILAVRIEGDVTVARAQWRDGINGPLIASPDFEAQSPGTTAFIDEQGNRWEVDGRGICATR